MAHAIDDLLREMVAQDASDLHMKAGRPPKVRVRGELVDLGPAPVDPATHNRRLLEILNDERCERLYAHKECDLSYSVEGLARFRVNMFWQRGNIGAVFRLIPFEIRTIDDLGLPPVTKSIAMLPRGLVLVTGPTGSGKSTSLAAMIDHINRTRRCHIMTVEDPIEYVHSDRTSIVNQRELATDTHSFSHALKHVLRQNPDVILVGEMRDLETIQLAITAAETGHLVLSTLHTVDAAQTIDRIVDVFDPEQQSQIRTQLSVTLQAVVSQTLLPVKEPGQGRVAAFEVMVATPAIRTLIREGKTHQLPMDIQTGQEFGMQTLDGHLLRLIAQGQIDYEHALAKCSNAMEFMRRVQNAGLMPTGPEAPLAVR
ncbi:type IV pilus twitching motility protein PilT [bacterium]|nr:MAG: type IV pilus twitching motility protein PilT [bacterium]